MKNIKILISTALVLSAIGCTKLDETLQGDLNGDQVGAGGGNNAALLRGIYNSMRVSYQGQERVFALGELPSDAAVVPTRGGDWDDNGAWRVLHSHNWDAENQYIRNAYNDLSGTLFASTDFLQFNPTPAQAAEARFLRAFTMFDILDGWDQVAYREPGENTLLPSKVRKGTEALDFIIAELNAIMPQLKAFGPIGASQDAAKVLLMKCYLNRGAFANRAAPTFAAADMQQVITLADQLINPNRYTLANNYFDNFAPTNGTAGVGTENIFTAEDVGGVESGGLNSRWHMTMHYNQFPGGWNGFTTLSDFYDKFTPADTRRGVAYPTPGAPNPGNRINVGFLAGQQYDTTNTPLKDRTGAPLVFTREVNAIETANNLEITGIRVNKYPIDVPNDGSGRVNNDYVYYRITDVMLMKAEAQLRTGSTAGLALVNQIRVKRGAAPFASLTLDNLLDERGRELYWENYRRQDLIRFGKFLQPYQLKPTDDPKYLLFTIPNEQLAVNPNLTQNPGYTN